MCNCTGTCNCSAVKLPTGPQGPIGPIGPVGNTGATGTAGPQGLAGTSGATPAKYAANIIVPSGTSAALPFPVSISLAALTSCNPLISTCASTPQNFDFVYTLWAQFGASTTWLDLKSLSTMSNYISSVFYDTSSNMLTIAFIQQGTFRIIVTG